MTSPRTETSSLQPSEDKSLLSGENKTALPDEGTAGEVQVTLVHHYTHQGVDLLPGAQPWLPAEMASQLVASYYATYA